MVTVVEVHKHIKVGIRSVLLESITCQLGDLVRVRFYCAGILTKIFRLNYTSLELVGEDVYV